jgi:hypothetical protein
MSDEDDDESGHGFSITLAVDGMYYREAVRMSELAFEKGKAFVEAEKAVSAALQDIVDHMNESARAPAERSPAAGL